jgi:hypothetical protein
MEFLFGNFLLTLCVRKLEEEFHKLPFDEENFLKEQFYIVLDGYFTTTSYLFSLKIKIGRKSLHTHQFTHVRLL